MPGLKSTPAVAPDDRAVRAVGRPANAPAGNFDLPPTADRVKFVADSESQGDARDERLANNEVIFRTVNEAIQQQALGFGVLDNYEFICECATASCFERISLSLQRYEAIRTGS